MDNFSEKEKSENQEEMNPKLSEKAEGTDIQFEEIIDIDKIQRELNQQFGDGTMEIAGQKGTGLTGPAPSSKPETVRLQIGAKDKKYVVYINQDNIDFMENLSAEERKEMINKILKEQNAAMRKKKAVEAKARLIKHVILACLTFVIGFPLMFLVVNKAMELTMQNFKEAKSNFSKLYQQQGKVKKLDPATYSK